MKSQTTVTADFTREQLMLFAVALQCNCEGNRYHFLKSQTAVTAPFTCSHVQVNKYTLYCGGDRCTRESTSSILLLMDPLYMIQRYDHDDGGMMVDLR